MCLIVSFQSQTLFYLDLLVRELESVSLTPLTFAPLHLAEVIAHDLMQSRSQSDLYRLRYHREHSFSHITLDFTARYDSTSSHLSESSGAVMIWDLSLYLHTANSFWASHAFLRMNRCGMILKWISWISNQVNIRCFIVFNATLFDFRSHRAVMTQSVMMDEVSFLQHSLRVFWCNYLKLLHYSD